MSTDFSGKRVTVMGLGAFGGGIGAVKFLSAQGALVTVTDLKPAAELAPALDQIADCPGVELRLGGHIERDFRKTDLVVASPAVPKQSRFLQAARDAGVPVTSEMNLFWERNPGRTICVTGSSGKSTTTALIYALLSGSSWVSRGDPAHIPHQGTAALRSPVPGAARQCVWLGGNIGKSLLPVLAEIQSADWVVLELSSFQLEDLSPCKPNPHVAVVTNFFPNHLDRHGSVEAYRHAKENILRWQTSDRLAILNQSDPDVSLWKTHARKYWFGREDEGRQGLFAVGFDAYKRRALYRNGPREQVLPLGNWLSLPGVHNFQNALAAACTALVLGASASDVAAGLSAFEGLPHRLQLVAETAGRKFFNDSKATTPEAALRALDAFRAPVVLLAGGYDKSIDLADLARGIVAHRVKAVALLGQTAPLIKQYLTQFDPKGTVSAKVHITLEGAFDWAVSHSAAGDVVLLSPGCASYDWFPNYEARGDEFTRLARAWRESSANAGT